MGFGFSLGGNHAYRRFSNWLLFSLIGNLKPSETDPLISQRLFTSLKDDFRLPKKRQRHSRAMQRLPLSRKLKL
jgi:hypothetical protein